MKAFLVILVRAEVGMFLVSELRTQLQAEVSVKWEIPACQNNSILFGGGFLTIFLNFEFASPHTTVCGFSFSHRVTLIIPNWGNLQIPTG